MSVLQNISSKHDKVAFLIGNGPNIASGIMPSWKDLLVAISETPIPFGTSGLTNTEVYDLVELYSNDQTDVKEKVKAKLQLLPSYNIEIHRRLMQFAESIHAPVLTTNFDESLEKSVNAKQFNIDPNGFTRFYPWKTYYGFRQLILPTDDFGIWKIHGDVKYKDSIRLGLSDYMGSVERARKLIHNGDDNLFRGKRQQYWEGHQTWLHIWFNLPIIIFGLGYGKDEVFLRWLLIQRRRYLNIYNEPMAVYFISKGTPDPQTNDLMLNLNVEIINIHDYQQIYG